MFYLCCEHHAFYFRHPKYSHDDPDAKGLWQLIPGAPAQIDIGKIPDSQIPSPNDNDFEESAREVVVIINREQIALDTLGDTARTAFKGNSTATLLEQPNKARVPSQVSPIRALTQMPIHIADFTGRSAELDRIHKILSEETKTAAITQSVQGLGRVAMQGLGGVGKTTLAIQYVDRFVDHYTGVCWCNAEEREGLLTGLFDLAVSLGLVKSDEGDKDKAAQAALRAIEEWNGNFLLVYDNVPSPDALKGFIPASGARLLMTSRFSDWRTYAVPVELDVWPIDEAVEYLCRDSKGENKADAAALAETLGRLPLAFSHAAAFCYRSQWSFRKYTAQAMEMISELPRDLPYPNSVVVTFRTAIRSVVETCPSAQLLMTFIAHCAPERIPILLIEGVIADDLLLSEALQALGNVSLIKRDPFPSHVPAWSLHRLVQAVARLDSEDLYAATTSRIGFRLNEIFPKTAYDEIEDWPVCEALLPHAQVVIAFDDAGFANGESVADLSEFLDAVGMYFLSRGPWDKARTCLSRALEIRRNDPGVSFKALSRSISNQALMLHADGEFKRACKLCREALLIRKKHFGINDIETLTSLNNLAHIYMDVSKTEKALPLFEQSLKHTTILCGEDDLQTAIALDNLGLLCRKMGQLDRARNLCESGLTIRVRKRGENHVDTAWSSDNLAAILQEQGDITGAFKLYWRAITIYRRGYGKRNSTQVEAIIGQAEILTERKRYVLALRSAKFALGIVDDELGQDHFERSILYERYAVMLIAMNRISEARSHLAEALKGFRSAFGSRDKRTVRCKRVLASLEGR